MISTIINKELKEISRQGLFKVLAIVLAALFITSLLVSNSYNNWLTDIQQQAAEDAREHWNNQGTKNSHSAAHYGIYLFKPASPLSLWDNGTDKYAGAGIYVEAHKRNSPQFQSIKESPMLARWGELTPSFVILYLLPLFIIWLGAGMVAGEKEQGTYRLLKSQGISTGKWLLSKALALWLIAGSIVLLLFLTAGIILSIIKENNFFATDTFLLFLLALLYSGIFVNITLFISARAKSNRSALLSLLIFWLVSVWLAPKLATQSAEAVFPSPTAIAFQKTVNADIARNGLDGHSTEGSKKIKELEQYWSRQYSVDSIQALPVNWIGIILQAGEDTNNIIIDRHYDSLYAIYRRQQGLHEYSGLISPFMPARMVSMGLSKTDLWSNIHFTDAVDEYRKQFVRILNEKLRDNSTYGGRDSQNSSFWKTLPAFQYKTSSVLQVWRNYKWSLLILGLWLFASIMLLYYSSLKLKVNL